MDTKFTVTLKNGEVFINGIWFAQCCWDGDAVGCAIADYINQFVD